MSLSGSFSYVLIPADPSLPIELRHGDKSGGLANDELLQQAKEYFHTHAGGASRAAAMSQMDSYSPQDRKTLADGVRQQMISANPNVKAQVEQMQDDALLELIKATESSKSCEITALTVPTRGNDFLAVSMYSADHTEGMPDNPRAMALVQASGHSSQIKGPVFVGRCRDKEETDVWERMDFTVQDTSPDAPWCTVARSKGGGGGGSSASAGAPPPSSGTILSQAFSNKNDEGYTWSQTEEEVELKFAVASGTKAKYVKVVFGSSTLKVTVAGQTLVNGSTGGTVNVQECTYTLQDEGKGRELCVTLAKKNPSTWPLAVSK